MMTRSSDTKSSRLILIFLQALFAAALYSHIPFIELPREHQLILCGLMLFAFVVASCLPGMLTNGWAITILAMVDTAILTGAIHIDRLTAPSLVVEYLLIMLMIASGPSLKQLFVLGGLLCAAYGVPLYWLGSIQSEDMLLLFALFAIMLVYGAKNDMINTELRERSAIEEDVRSKALSDTLTRLPNRAHFRRHVSRAVQCASRNREFVFAILFIDLDGFKPINDGLGHKAGDAVLKEVAKRLQSCLRRGDVVGRYGGDEFTILVNQVSSAEDAVRVAERVLKKVKEPIHVGQAVHVGASIGIALSTNSHSCPEDLIRDADAAMYSAKSLGKDRYEISGHSQQTTIASSSDAQLRRMCRA